MMKACKCGSYAINHHCHGRDGSDDDLCDVCYWRKRAEQPAQQIVESPDDWSDWKVTPPQPQPAQQEPVAWMWRCKPYCNWPEWCVSLQRPADSGCDGNKRTEGYEDIPLYNAPQPQRQPQQEPVAWRTFDGEGGYEYRSYEMNEQYAQEWEQRNPKHKGWVEPLYTTPPPCPTCEALARTVMMDQTGRDTSPPAQRTWVGLTDEQMADYLGDRYHIMTENELEFFRLGEAAHSIKEKNT